MFLSNLRRARPESYAFRGLITFALAYHGKDDREHADEDGGNERQRDRRREVTNRAEEDGVYQRTGHRGCRHSQGQTETANHADIAHRIQGCGGDTESVARRCAHRRAGVRGPEQGTTQAHQTERQGQESIGGSGSQENQHHQRRSLHYQPNRRRGRAPEAISIRPAPAQGAND